MVPLVTVGVVSLIRICPEWVFPLRVFRFSGRALELNVLLDTTVLLFAELPSVAVQMALPLRVLRFSGSALGSHVLLDTPVLLFAELPRDAVCLGLFRCRRHARYLY